MRVRAAELCPGSEERGPAFQLWEQARAGLLATVVARESNSAQAVSMKFRRIMDIGSDLVRQLQIGTASGTSTHPFIAFRTAAAFATDGYMSEDAAGRVFYAPDADVLLDESFAATHCFHLVGEDDEHRGQIGLAFTPAPSRRREPIVDVRGVIWIDRDVPAVRTLDFLYTALERAAMDEKAGGHIEFITLPNGISIVERWVLRLVDLAIQSPARSSRLSRLRREDRTDVRAVAIEEIGGQVLSAEWPDGTKWRAPETGVDGRVVRALGDSLPVRRALATIEGFSDTTSTDSAGAFSIRALMPGRYRVVVIDTALSRFTPPQRVAKEVVVSRDRVTDVRLEVRALTDVLTELCKDQHPAKQTTTILGQLSFAGVLVPRDATVSAQWQADYVTTASDSPIGIVVGQQTSTVDDGGRFAVCGVAMDRPIRLRLRTGNTLVADTTFFARQGSFSTLTWRISVP
jgi:hypothetical protein